MQSTLSHDAIRTLSAGMLATAADQIQDDALDHVEDANIWRLPSREPEPWEAVDD